MALFTLLTMRDVPVRDWDTRPDRNVPAGLVHAGLRIDRTELDPSGSGSLAEIEILISLDGGVTWPEIDANGQAVPNGAEIWLGPRQPDGSRHTVSLWTRATVPAGAIALPPSQGGGVAQFSQIGLDMAPNGQAKVARLSYRTFRADRFAVQIETR